MTGGEVEIALQLAKFALGSAKASNQYAADNLKRQREIENANRQAAINNKLAYNAHLNLNQQQMLEMQKYGFEKRDLQKNIRAQRATNEAIRASFGGDLGQQGATLEATILNINRHGYEALARKDLNFKILATDFNIRHRNVTLETESKNNAAFSGLSTGGSALGTGLSILGSGLQTKLNYDKDIKGR